MAVSTADLQILINAKDEASGVFKKLGKTMGKFAKVAAVGVGALGVATAGATFAAVKMASSYQTAMKEVATLGVPTKQMAVLEKGVLDLSRRLGIDAVKATGALYQAISAGVPPENALAFLETASKAAIAGVTDAETAVDGISTVVNAFASQNITAAEAADIMFATVKAGKTNFEELSASIANVAPLANATGVSFGEVSAALATMTASGTATAVATTQIRSAIQSLTKPSAELTEIFEEAGFASGELAVRQLGFAKASEIVSKATGGSVAKMTKLLGSIEGVQGVLGVTGAQADAFARNMEGMENSAGAADAAFATMSESFSFQMGRVRESFKTGFIEVGLLILPALTPIAEFLADKLPEAIDATVGKVKDIAQSFRDLAGLFGDVVEAGNAWGGTGGTLEAIRISASDAGGPLTYLIDEVPKLEGVLGPVNDAFGAMGRALDRVTGKQYAGHKAIDLTIVAWDKIVKPVETARDILEKLEGPLTAVKDALEPITKSFTDLGDSMGSSFKEIMDKMGPLIPVIVNLLLPGWVKMLELIGKLMPVLKKFGATIIPIVAGAIDKLTSAWNLFFGGPDADPDAPNIFDSMMGAAEKLAGVLGDTLGVAIDKVAGFLSDLAVPAKAFAESVADMATNIINNVEPALDKFGELLDDTVGPALEPTVDLLKRVGESLGGIVTSVGNVVKAIGDELGPIFDSLVENILPPLLEMWNDIAKALEKDLLPIFDKIVEALEGALTEAISTVSDLFTKFLEDHLKPWIEWTRKHVLPVVLEIARIFEEVLLAALTLVTDLLKGDFEAAWEFVKELDDIVAVLLVPLAGLLLWMTYTSVILPILTFGWGLLTAAASAFTVVMGILTSPITIIIIAIVVLIAIVLFLAKNWDEISEKIMEIWGVVTSFLTEKLTELGEFFTDKLEAIGTFFTEAFQGIMDWLSENWQEIVKIIAMVFTGPIGLIVAFGTDAFGLRTKMVEVFTALIKWITDKWEGLLGWFSDAWTTAKDKVLGVVTGLRDGIMGMFDAIISKVSGFFNKIKDIPKKVKEAVKDVPLIGGIAGAFGFQHGGAFTVGGSGGPDSQLVGFRATPGERVTVSTPEQMRSGRALVQQTIIVQGSIVTERQLSALAVRAMRDATRLNGSVLDVTSVVA
jgi:TP901 family phage tail tape measure protein